MYSKRLRGVGVGVLVCMGVDIKNICLIVGEKVDKESIR